MLIPTVQVGLMAGNIPPGSFILFSTISASLAVIILIFGGKGLTTMMRKRITGSSCRTVTKVVDYSPKYF